MGSGGGASVGAVGGIRGGFGGKDGLVLRYGSRGSFGGGRRQSKSPGQGRSQPPGSWPSATLTQLIELFHFSLLEFELVWVNGVYRQ